MTLEEIIQNLKNTQNKSDAPTEYEIVLTDAFRFLGFQAKTIGGKGDTDVLLTANIGKQSYKVDVDGKTSKNEKISDAQINWLSLKDHKEKNNSNFVVVAGPGFAGGNLEKRAKEYDVSLLTTDELIKILEAHSKYPFTLLELKDLFAEAGYLTEQVEDLLSQNHVRRSFLEKFKTIIEEIEKLQNTRLGYFTFESLAGREKIQELEIELEDIENIIQLLRIPFINAISEVDKNKFVFTLEKRDLSNTFFQISQLISGKPLATTTKVISEEQTPTKVDVEQIDDIEERTVGTKYYKWTIRGTSLFATAREENPYEHSCPVDHFKTIISKIIEAFQNQNVINNDIIYQSLVDQQLSPNRLFKGKAEEYKIRMIIGVLELEGFTKWTGSLRPIEYTLDKPIINLIKWSQEIATKNN
jgi:ubiquinone biosynthesis protein Coq4